MRGVDRDNEACYNAMRPNNQVCKDRQTGPFWASRRGSNKMGRGASFSKFTRRPMVLGAFGAIVLLTAILSAATTERFSWSRKHIEASDGVSIEIVYQTQPDGREVRAQPVWVKVSGERFSGVENVKILFENYYLANAIRHEEVNPQDSPSNYEQQQMAAALNLTYSGDGEYSVNLGSVPIWYARDNGTEQHFRQQVSITIDGKPLRNAAGESTFQLVLPR